HIATMMQDPAMTRLLLQDERIRKIKDNKNIYGQTALDIAIANKQDEIILLLSNKPIETIRLLPQYGHPMRDFSQEILDKNLIEYLTSKGREATEIVDEDGNCHGWSFL